MIPFFGSSTQEPRKRGVSASELLLIREIADDDRLMILDKSDLTQSPHGSLKAVTLGKLRDFLLKGNQP